jgi:hypothetical protein
MSFRRCGLLIEYCRSYSGCRSWYSSRAAASSWLRVVCLSAVSSPTTDEATALCFRRKCASSTWRASAFSPVAAVHGHPSASLQNRRRRSKKKSGAVRDTGGTSS